MFVDVLEKRADFSSCIEGESSRKIVTEVSGKRARATSIFYIEDGSSTFLRNAVNSLPDYTLSHLSRQQSSSIAKFVFDFEDDTYRRTCRTNLLCAHVHCVQKDDTMTEQHFVK
jgi:hypothetical protein